MEMDNARKLRLGKAEKLRLKSLVDSLFDEGRSLYDFPLRVIYRPLTADELEHSFRCGTPVGVGPIQMLITVPKKKRRHAVDRVLMRRRIREAYRLNRMPLKQALDASPDIRTLSLAFIYMHNENVDYRLVEKKMRRLLGKIAKSLTPGKPDADSATNGQTDEKV